MKQVNQTHLAGLLLADEKTGFSIPMLSGLIAQASAAPEQEPARFERLDREGDWEVISHAEYEKSKDSAGIYQCRALYTHADPSEVERLRAELSEALAARDKWGSNFQKAISAGAAIEQKLAEAQALLRVMRSHEDESSGYKYPVSCWFPQIDAFLSATAQPAECCCPKIGEPWNPNKHGADCPVHAQPAQVKS